MKKSLPPPYVLYCDIESLLQKTHVPGIIHEHLPISVGCILVPNGELKSSPIADANQIKIFTGTDCMTKFVNYIHQLQSQLFEWCHDKCKVPITFTLQQRCSHANARQCKCCRENFSDKKIKVAHHSHLSGKFIATVCSQCNTKMKQALNQLPIVFHNLKGYDGHFMINALASSPYEWDLSPVMQSSEKFISMNATYHFLHNDKQVCFHLRFIDSYAFLTDSLDALVNSIPHDDLILTSSLMRTKYQNVSDDVIYGKGVFPYDFMKDLSSLQYTQLPPYSAFNNTLKNNEPISKESYARAQKAWLEFKCTTFQDYMEAYLMMDVLQLADVFESFRHTVMTDHQLDPINYVTLPSLAWSIATKQCGDKFHF